MNRVQVVLLLLNALAEQCKLFGQILDLTLQLLALWLALKRFPRLSDQLLNFFML